MIQTLIDSGSVKSSANNPESIEAFATRYCVVAFELDVPDSDFYEIEVGKRGGSTESRAELEDQEWKVAYKMGL